MDRLLYAGPARRHDKDERATYLAMGSLPAAAGATSKPRGTLGCSLDSKPWRTPAQIELIADARISARMNYCIVHNSEVVV
jgi:hypothetical protein